jgi:hypothetical protein
MDTSGYSWRVRVHGALRIVRNLFSIAVRAESEVVE